MGLGRTVPACKTIVVPAPPCDLMQEWKRAQNAATVAVRLNAEADEIDRLALAHNSGSLRHRQMTDHAAQCRMRAVTEIGFARSYVMPQVLADWYDQAEEVAS